MRDYEEFLRSKSLMDIDTGISADVELNPKLFDFQRDIVRWALRRGRAAIFADCGMGKTAMQMEWAKHICEYTNGNVLILAPLAVAHQTQKEGLKFGIESRYCRSQNDVKHGITITNYQMLDKFDCGSFAGIVLDESSIIKNYSGKFRNQIMESFASTAFKLACTATPSPNDFMELGNHAEFVGSMTRTEMLSMFFVHDGGDTAKWRLKGHAESEFWKWICSWAVMIRKPSDLGYPDNDFILPELNVNHIIVDVDTHDVNDGMLFRMAAKTLQERQRERKNTTESRVSKALDIVRSKPDEQWLIWCDRNLESEMMSNGTGITEISGSHSDDQKTDAMSKFAHGEIRSMVTKPSICGFGMNWQNCHNVIFLGLSDSYESYYQAIRRCWRFGQKHKVECYIITASTEGNVVDNINRKDRESMKMASEMLSHMKVYNADNIKGLNRIKSEYKTKHIKGNSWDAYLGDCVQNMRHIEDNSIDFSIYSPPFSSLYTYSNSDRDMGNCKSDDEFFTHYGFLVDEHFRTMRPGRNISVHCMNLPTSKERDGYIGIRDFRGDIIRLFQSKGFIYHSEVVIWKDPVVAMQRTKALGLLHKQIVKDSSMSRQGIPDYVITFRKPGDNNKPVHGELTYFSGDNSFQSNGRLSIDIWQRYASPVWMDINPSRTLQKESAREEKDERHICPLQLDVIERCIQLWSMPGDVVLSPFMGIGSEGYVSINSGRRFIGFELKESYFKQAVENLKNAEASTTEPSLFDNMEDNNG